MKIYVFVVLFVVFFLAGCGQQKITPIDVDSIANLSDLEIVLTDVSEGLAQGTLDSEYVQTLLIQLQDKYLELTDVDQQDIEVRFAAIQKSLIQDSVFSYTLPLRAKKLGMTEPKNMDLDKNLSRQYITEEGNDSTILVYKGDYVLAFEQAKIIADIAGLHVSETLKQGQAVAENNDLRYISGLDIEGLKEGIVYVNHDLLDQNVETFLSVSVDKDGMLTLEATRYK